MHSYLRMILFTLGLLAGVQIPGVLELYFQRVDARLQQAQVSLIPFQSNADEHFDGNLTALIQHYRTNPDPVVQRDATSIQSLVDQRTLLEREQAQQGAPWYRQLLHFASAADRTLVQDTLNHYNYLVPLNQAAIFCGLLVGLLGALLGDLLFAILAWPFRPAPRRRMDLR
ncbi:hypothetical protein G114_09234 [Aeromonas diversa CDC 2478-85]|uniref:DUF2937 family protein n=1 Tax=Aeromonas diversa CDC 2478-85 TaxID=1268237 RepID=N9U1H8_9GAMM|nr:DUF2937 family protein [Aeromonas diversa]ENY72165.1 hypothetical protein G114_09234 [Aeromonas diversa CDC 2478-85]